MVYFKILCVAALATFASCEPPVQGYNYRRPSYRAPANNYLPPPSPSYGPPQNRYLPPPTFGPTNQPSFDSTFVKTETTYNPDLYNNAYEDEHDHHTHAHESEVPKSYEFGYSVKDAESGNDYDRHETSDGNTVRGEYRVQLPDGRTQIVTYHADWKTGFHADVRYEGEAHYPEPTHNKLNQGYLPPSDFSGSLTGFHGNRNSRPSTSYGPPGYQ